MFSQTVEDADPAEDMDPTENADPTEDDCADDVPFNSLYPRTATEAAGPDSDSDSDYEDEDSFCSSDSSDDDEFYDFSEDDDDVADAPAGSIAPQGNAANTNATPPSATAAGGTGSSNTGRAGVWTDDDERALVSAVLDDVSLSYRSELPRTGPPYEAVATKLGRTKQAVRQRMSVLMDRTGASNARNLFRAVCMNNTDNTDETTPKLSLDGIPHQEVIDAIMKWTKAREDSSPLCKALLAVSSLDQKARSEQQHSAVLDVISDIAAASQKALLDQRTPFFQLVQYQLANIVRSETPKYSLTYKDFWATIKLLGGGKTMRHLRAKFNGVPNFIIPSLSTLRRHVRAFVPPVAARTGFNPQSVARAVKTNAPGAALVLKFDARTVNPGVVVDKASGRQVGEVDMGSTFHSHINNHCHVLTKAQ